MTLVNADTGEIVGRTLEECETVIAAGLASFFDVGDALAEVRDSRLYRGTHETFEAYCSERWGFQASRARQLIAASETVTSVTALGAPAPKNEAQARALNPVKANPETAAEAMRKANEATGGDPTAADITAAVKEAQAKQKQKAEDNEAIRDLNAKHQPEGFDPKENERKLEERGKWSECCREIAKLRDAEAFVSDHRDDFTKRHIDQAERAYAWLDTFLLTYREAE